MYTMAMEMPYPDMVDRYSILLLKRERLPQNDQIIGECQLYEKGFLELGPEMQDQIKGDVESLKEINGKCWDLEAAIRQGKEGDLGLEEVGRRALMLRDLNKERVARKNAIVRPGEYKEIKVDHASE